MAQPRRWDIVDASFPEAVGHEQGKHRPHLVLSNDQFNQRSGLVALVPLTSARTQAKYPSEVELPGLPGICDAGVIMVQQLRTLSQNRVTRVRGPLKDPVLQRKVREAVVAFLDLDEP